MTVLFTSAVLCFALIGTLWIIWMEGKRDLQNILDEGKQITNSFARQSILALLYGMGENARSQAEMTLRFPGVKQVDVYNKNGVALLQQGEGSDWKPALDKPGSGFIAHLSHETSGAWHFIAPVFTQTIEQSSISPFELNRPDPEYLGYVHVVISKERLHAVQRKKFYDILLSTIIFTLVTLALLLWLTSRLTKPLNDLAQLMKRAENGETGVRAVLRGPKEVLNMGRVFNKMMSVLGERAEKLDRQNSMLLREMEERKQAEAEREQLHQQLLQARKMEAIGQLTGGIAHDFNNILASIMGYTELALLRFAQTKEGKLFDYLTEVHRAGGRARDLVGQMMAFSRRDFGSPRMLDARPLVTEIVKMLGSTFPSTIQVNTEFEEKLPMILMDPVQLQQVVMNLCINARDAMNGKGQLTIRGRNLTVKSGKCTSCHTDVTGEFLELVIEDNGSGMDQALLDKIFDPFFTTKEVGSGTGMGLSVVHGIVHEHKGHIQLQTVPGRGTVFRLLLPAQVGETKTIERIKAECNMSEHIGHGRILVVDDESSLANYFTELLSEQGFQVKAFTDAKAALSHFETDPSAVDLVITDQTMPNLTGSELATQMLALRPNLPVILCTGYSAQIDESSAKKLNIRSYFRKPVEANALLAAVKQLIEESISDMEHCMDV